MNSPWTVETNVGKHRNCLAVLPTCKAFLVLNDAGDYQSLIDRRRLAASVERAVLWNPPAATSAPAPLPGPSQNGFGDRQPLGDARLRAHQRVGRKDRPGQSTNDVKVHVRFDAGGGQGS